MARVDWDEDGYEEDWGSSGTRRRQFQEDAERIAQKYNRSFPDYTHHGRDERHVGGGGGGGGGDVTYSGTVRTGFDTAWEAPASGLYEKSGGGAPDGTAFPAPPEGAMHADRIPEKDAVNPDLLDIGDIKNFLGFGSDVNEGEQADIKFNAPSAPGTRPPFITQRPIKRVKNIMILQGISTVALFIIFSINHYLNPLFYNTISEFAEPVRAVNNMFMMPFTGMALGFGLVLFSYVHSYWKKRIMLGALGLFVILFFGPSLLAALGGAWMLALVNLFQSFLVLVKLLVLFLLWSPLILGVLGIWLESRLALYVSTLLLLSSVVILDVFLILFDVVPEKQIWSIPLILFACGLFIYFEFGESAIRFNHLYLRSVLVDSKSIQSQHIVRLSKRYLVLTGIVLVVTVFVTLWIFNSNDILVGLGHAAKGVPGIGKLFTEVFKVDKFNNSLVMETVYGSLVSMGVVIFFLIIVGTVVRNWYDITIWTKNQYFNVSNAVAAAREAEEEEKAKEVEIVKRVKEPRRDRKKKERLADRKKPQRNRSRDRVVERPRKGKVSMRTERVKGSKKGSGKGKGRR